MWLSVRFVVGAKSWLGCRNESFAVGVAHDASDVCAVSVSATPRPQRIPDDSESSARGVAHDPHTAVTRFDSESPFVVPDRSAYVSVRPHLKSRANGVGQAAMAATFGSCCWPPSVLGVLAIQWSSAIGVGQGLCGKEQALSDVRRADARSAQICRPEGVLRAFHVRLNKVEPREAVLARNLLSKHNCRAALRDELEEMRPEMPLISNPIASACVAERLAGARASPNWATVRPPSAAQGV